MIVSHHDGRPVASSGALGSLGDPTQNRHASIREGACKSLRLVGCTGTEPVFVCWSGCFYTMLLDCLLGSSSRTAFTRQKERPSTNAATVQCSNPERLKSYDHSSPDARRRGKSAPASKPRLLTEGASWFDRPTVDIFSH